jgi:transposase
MQLTGSLARMVTPRRARRHPGAWQGLQGNTVNSRMPFSKGAQHKFLFMLKTLLVSVSDIVGASTDDAPSRATLFRWSEHYDLTGYAPEYSKAVQKARRGSERVCELRKMTKRIRRALKRLVIRHPDYYLDELQHALLCHTGVRVSQSTISRALRESFGMSLRVFTAKASHQDFCARARFRHRLSTYPDPSVFLWLDETHRKKQTFESFRAWARRGGKAISLDKYFCPRGEGNATLLGAVDINGFVLGMCEYVFMKRNDDDNDPTHGTIGGERYLEYVNECVIPAMTKPGAPWSVVIIDNAPVHTAEVIDAFEAAGFEVIFLPPYSPDFNPIETAFHQYKASIKRAFIADRLDGRHAEAHLEALLAVKKVNMCNYLRAMECYRNVPPAATKATRRRKLIRLLIVYFLSL